MKVTIRHSESKNAYNIIGGLGYKYKIARIPYVEVQGSKMLTEMEKMEALSDAEFICFCFNNKDKILSNI